MVLFEMEQGLAIREIAPHDLRRAGRRSLYFAITLAGEQSRNEENHPQGRLADCGPANAIYACRDLQRLTSAMTMISHGHDLIIIPRSIQTGLAT
ncbi:hypothetical protein AAFG13_35130 [Bradyrhizobium sp. B124]|uniref:hypothetical protein n=1 Tax=Bradyrhizobium sp. B124 TaxID=3140245 RepID=UPI003184063D